MNFSKCRLWWCILGELSFLPPADEFAMVMFLHVSCQSVHRGGVSPGPRPGGRLRGLAGGGFPGPHGGGVEGSDWGVSRPTPRGVSRPTPRGVSRPTTGGVCISACTEADTPTPPPSRRLLLRSVRILLECILVEYKTYREMTMLTRSVNLQIKSRST